MKHLNARKLVVATALLVSAAAMSPASVALAQEKLTCVAHRTCEGYWTTIYLIIPVYKETCDITLTCS
jgi:hypothetical protein